MSHHSNFYFERTDTYCEGHYNVWMVFFDGPPTDFGTDADTSSIWRFVGTFGWVDGEGYIADKTLLANVPALKGHLLGSHLDLAWSEIITRLKADDHLWDRLQQKRAKKRMNPSFTL